MKYTPSLTAANDAPVRFHMLFSEQWGQRQLKYLTIKPEEAHQRAADYMLNITPDSIPALLAMGEQAWNKVVDDETWNVIAKDIDKYQRFLESCIADDLANTQYGTTPPDLPPSVAKQRDQVLRMTGNCEDLATRRELTEILMAAQYRRPVDESLFRPESLEGPRWDDQVNSACIQDVEHRLHEVSTQLQDPKTHEGSAIDRARLIAECEEMEALFYDLAETEPGARLAVN